MWSNSSFSSEAKAFLSVVASISERTMNSKRPIFVLSSELGTFVGTEVIIVSVLNQVRIGTKLPEMSHTRRHRKGSGASLAEINMCFYRMFSLTQLRNCVMELNLALPVWLQCVVYVAVMGYMQFDAT